MNHHNVIKQLSFVKSIKSSRCTAIFVRQVNKTPYLFIWLLFDFLVYFYCLIVTGPKQLASFMVKGSLHTAILSFGKFPKSCGFDIEQLCLHNQYVDQTLGVIDLPSTI